MRRGVASSAEAGARVGEIYRAVLGREVDADDALAQALERVDQCIALKRAQLPGLQAFLARQ